MKAKNRHTSTEATGLGVFVHVNVTAPTEPENRPPPASRLPSWVINTKGTCPSEDCPDRIEGFIHRHVPGYPLAEHERE